LRSNLGQVVHTYVPLTPSSIIWYWPNSWGLNRHTMRCTSPISVILQCQLGYVARGGLYITFLLTGCEENLALDEGVSKEGE